MAAKEIEVTCPCCEWRLTVDVLTGSVLRRSPPAAESGPGTAPDAGRWDEARERVQERPAGSQDRMERALEEERTKEDRLDDLFRKANEKLRRPPEDPF